MRLKWTKLIVGLMLASAMGLHWTALQSMGWVQMFVTFAHTGPVKEALIKTFDGNHPCKVCKLVQEGKQTEKKHEAQKIQLKFDCWLESKEAFLFPPSTSRLLVSLTNTPDIRLEAPPAPPPRAA